MKIQGYGWKPQLPDQRDKVYAGSKAEIIHNYVDLRHKCPPVYDQGQLGSCTANAIAAALEFEQMGQKLGETTPSRLFIYYNERLMEGTVNSDSGAQIRDGIKSVNTTGVCPESVWPYDVNKVFDKPSQTCYTDAVEKCLKYESIDNTNLPLLLECLQAGYPFVFGISVYESFESPLVAQTGVVSMPQPNEQLIGGHAVMAVGYDRNKQVFIVRNSWGSEWGKAGYFTIPFEYITSSLASDFWTIRVVSE